MNNVLLEHDPHALKYRIGESSYQMNTKTLVVIFFDQLIKIYSITKTQKSIIVLILIDLVEQIDHPSISNVMHFSRAFHW